MEYILLGTIIAVAVVGVVKKSQREEQDFLFFKKKREKEPDFENVEKNGFI